MIRLERVSKSYVPGKKALDGLDLTIPAGTVYGLLGANGAGKTTAIRLMSGILNPDEGRIIIAGADLAAAPELAKSRLAYVPDVPDLYPRLSGVDWLRFVAVVFHMDRTRAEQRIWELAERFAMTSALPDAMAAYSLGMRQKISLMAGLLHQPQVLILDEPLRGLDPPSAMLFKSLMRECAAAGGTVLFSTHILEVAERLCDRVGILHGGRLIAEDTPGNLSGSESLESVFMELTGHEAHV